MGPLRSNSFWRIINRAAAGSLSWRRVLPLITQRAHRPARLPRETPTPPSMIARTGRSSCCRAIPLKSAMANGSPNFFAWIPVSSPPYTAAMESTRCRREQCRLRFGRPPWVTGWTRCSPQIQGQPPFFRMMSLQRHALSSLPMFRAAVLFPRFASQDNPMEFSRSLRSLASSGFARTTEFAVHFDRLTWRLCTACYASWIPIGAT